LPTPQPHLSLLLLPCTPQCQPPACSLLLLLARCSRYSHNALGLHSLFSLLAHCSHSLLTALAARSLLTLHAHCYHYPLPTLAVVTACSPCSRLWLLRSHSPVLLLIARAPCARCLHCSPPALAAAAASLQFAAVTARCLLPMLTAPLVARAWSLLSSLAPRTRCCHCSLPGLAVIAARSPCVLLSLLVARAWLLLSSLAPHTGYCHCCRCSLPVLAAVRCRCSLHALAAVTARCPGSLPHSARSLLLLLRSTHSLLSMSLRRHGRRRGRRRGRIVTVSCDDGGSSSTSVWSTSAPQRASTATPAASSSFWASSALAAVGEVSGGGGGGSSSASVCSPSALAVIRPGGSSVTPLGIPTLPNSEPLLPVASNGSPSGSQGCLWCGGVKSAIGEGRR
jgi:hypothetical protein